MGTIRDQFRTVLQPDARVGKQEAEALVDLAQSDGKIDAAESADFQNLVTKHSDAFDAAAWKVLEKNAGALGLKLGKHAAVPTLAGKAELAEVAAGKKSLSISQNRNDPAVALVQQGLVALGRLTKNPALSLPKGGADGDLGPETTAAVKAFQASAGLTVDGVVGRKTLAALEAALVKATPVAPPAQAAPSLSLKSARFSGEATLQKVSRGELQLGRGTRGEAVKAVQQALIDIGYPMPRFGADGDFGGETQKALVRFQKHHGLTPTGAVDTATLAALDRVAPAPGAKAVHSPEYDKMFADGVLEVTLGIGFDETGADLSQRKKALEGLADRGFKRIYVRGKTDEQLRAMGLDPKTLDRAGTYYARDFEHDGKPVKALVKWVDRYTKDPAARFGQGMAQSELVLYGGHARYGSGPDFDHKESTAGNFAIGVNAKGHRTGALTESYDAHMREILKDTPNALETTKLTDRYQMMFFSGCSTKNYLDELRGIPANKDERNLDLIASDDILYWRDISDNVMGMLDGVMQGQNTAQLNESLWERNKVSFTFDGFVGNTPQA